MTITVTAVEWCRIGGHGQVLEVQCREPKTVQQKVQPFYEDDPLFPSRYNIIYLLYEQPSWENKKKFKVRNSFCIEASFLVCQNVALSVFKMRSFSIMKLVLDESFLN